MDFEISHSLPADPKVVAAALLDQDFQASLDDIGALEDRAVLSQQETPEGKVVRRTRCVLGIDLGAAKRFLGDAEPAWVEVATWDPETMTWGWKIEPEVAADLLESAGTIAIEPDGEGAIRIVTGRVKVKVPLYGSRVEEHVVRGITQAYEEEAERLRAWLAD